MVRLGSVVHWNITASGSIVAVVLDLGVCSAQILLYDKTVAAVGYA
jgi:hypothetical protein